MSYPNTQRSIAATGTITHPYDTSGSMLFITPTAVTTINITLNITGVPVVANRIYEVKAFIFQNANGPASITAVQINTGAPTGSKALTTTYATSDFTLHTITIMTNASSQFYVMNKAEKYV